MYILVGVSFLMLFGRKRVMVAKKKYRCMDRPVSEGVTVVVSDKNDEIDGGWS